MVNSQKYPAELVGGSPTRLRRQWWRPIRRALLVLVLGLIVVLVVLPMAFGGRPLARIIQPILAQQSQLPVTLGYAYWSWFEGLTLEQLAVHQESTGGPILARIEEVRVRPEWEDFLRGGRRAEVDCRGVILYIRRDGSGEWNFRELMGRQSGEAVPTGLTVTVDSLRIQVVDEVTHFEWLSPACRLSLDPLAGEQPGYAVHFRLYQKQGHQVAAATGWGKVVLDRSCRSVSAYDGGIAAKDLELAELAGLLQHELPVGPAGGTLDTEMDVRYADGQANAQGWASLVQPKVIWKYLGEEPLEAPGSRLDYDVAVALADQVVTVQRLHLTLAEPGDGSPEEQRLFELTASGRVDLQRPRERLNVDLAVDAHLGRMKALPQEGQFARALVAQLDRELQGKGPAFELLVESPERLQTIQKWARVLSEAVPIEPFSGVSETSLQLTLREDAISTSGSTEADQIVAYEEADRRTSYRVQGGRLEWELSANRSEPTVHVNKLNLSGPLGSVSAFGRVTVNEGNVTVDATVKEEANFGALAAGTPERRLLDRFVATLSQALAENEGLINEAALPTIVRDQLKGLPEYVKVVQRNLSLSGRMTSTTVLSGPLERLGFSTDVDTTQTAVAWPGRFQKPAGVASLLTANGEISPQGWAVTMPRVVLGSLKARAGVAWQKGLKGKAAGGGEGELTVSLDVDDLAGFRPSEYGPAPPELKLNGGVHLAALVAGLPEKSVVSGELRMADLMVSLPPPISRTVTTSGTVAMSPGVVMTRDPLVVKANGNELTVGFRAEHVVRSQALMKLVRGWRPKLEPAEVDSLVDQPVLTLSVSGRELDLTFIKDTTPPLVPSRVDVSAYADTIKRASVTIEADLGKVLQGDGQTMTNLKAFVTMAPGGLVQVKSLHWGYAGGTISFDGTAVNLAKSPAEYLIVEKVDGVGPTAMMETMVARDFPGLNYSGRFSSSLVERGSLYGDPVKWRSSVNGSRVSQAAEGQLVGKKLPDYITTVFPDLKPTVYRYSEMYSKTVVRQGTQYSDLSFRGERDVFFMGTTSPDGHTDYTMGVVMTETKNGKRSERRIPLVRYRGRIEGTEFVEQEATMISPLELTKALLGQGVPKFFPEGPIDWEPIRNMGVPVTP